MIAFLTSHIGGSYRIDGKRYPTNLNNDNALVDQLRKRWPSHCKMLLIGTAPDCFERNDSLLECFRTAFPMSGLPVSEMDVCDDRNEQTVEHLSDYDVILLSGGHVPTQMAYFKKIKLKERLADFHGIIIGVSAGSMNSAKLVYAQPEYEGESADPCYQRFFPGLGITNMMILPHYQDIKNDILDGQRLFEDITYPDSFGREFYALVDGSFVTVTTNETILYGEAYLIKDGTVQQICKKDESLYIEVN